MRQTLLGDTFLLPTPFYRQLRGKKRTAKQPATVKVKLRENIQGYGRRGSIIPVAPGRMRNIWYPRQMAEYMTEGQLREQREVVAERDVTFGKEGEEGTAKEKRAAEEEMINVQIELIEPRRATEIMDDLLPPEIVFYRTPIPTDEQDNPETANAPSKDIQTRDSATRETPKLTYIYGSISVLDIQTAVQELLARDEEGKRIVPTYVELVHDPCKDGDGHDSRRIRALGSFSVMLAVRKWSLIQRTIVVKSSQEEPVVAE